MDKPTRQVNKNPGKRLSAMVFNVVLPVVFIYFLFQLLKDKFEISDLVSSLDELEIEWKGIYLLLCFGMSYMNWWLEAKKWKAVLDAFVVIDMKTSLKSVLVGVSVGIFTPARLGEYAGRMMLLDKEKKPGGAIATLVSSLGQMAVTLLIGLVSLLLLIHEFQLVELKFNILMIASVLSTISIIVSYLYLPSIVRALSKFRYLKNYLSKYRDLKFSKALMVKVLQFSFLRYLVYTIQYLFVFYFLGVEYTCLVFIGHIAIVFLIQSLMPLPPFAALIGRGGVALLVFSNLGIDEVVILSATLIIWVINLIFPALCGMMILSKHGRKVYT